MNDWDGLPAIRQPRYLGVYRDEPAIQYTCVFNAFHHSQSYLYLRNSDNASLDCAWISHGLASCGKEDKVSFKI